MIKVSEPFIYWNYFIALESDLENLSRYIEFVDHNFNAYSIELARLLLSSSSEIDVVIKELCKLISPDEKRENIIDFKNIIKSNLPEFINESVHIHRFGISVKPWNNWNSEENPEWWKSYNHVKHERSLYFEEANLRNTIRSVGALLITNYYYYKKLFEQESGSLIKPKKVTEKLQQKSKFVQLDNCYYYDNVVI